MLWWHYNKRTLSLHGVLRNMNPKAFTFSVRLPVFFAHYSIWRSNECIILVL